MTRSVFVVWRVLLLLIPFLGTEAGRQISRHYAEKFPHGDNQNEGYTYTDGLDSEWDAFKVLHNKTYANATEESYRRRIWEENGDYVNKHNELAASGKYSYTLKQTEFSDHTEAELIDYLTGGNPNRQPPSYEQVCKRINPPVIPNFDPDNDPDTVDYRKMIPQCLTRMKDQKQLLCGSCWAFGVTSGTEIMNCLQNGVLIPLSEQQLVDCSWPYGNEGCNGGFSNDTLNYIMDYGQQSEESYPYTAKDQKCRYDSSKVVASVQNYTIWPCEDEELMKHLVANYGPIIVSYYAAGDFFWLADGVLDIADCPPRDSNHIFTLVGYGTTDGGLDYWLIRNSFGPFWGVQGYGKLRRGVNLCSIANYPTTVKMSHGLKKN